jgi:spermidine synthase
MITHIPILSHPNPKSVLVIGGGDGGVLREVLKHPEIEEIILVEIDATVIELSKKYLPNMSRSFDDPRITVNLCDGFKFLQETDRRFDVIITDSSDPDGPAAVFYEQNYFQLLNRCLHDDGIVIMQASENVWLKIELLQHLKSLMSKVFPRVEYCYTMVPTYTSGQLGLMICSKDASSSLKTPLRTLDNESHLCKYYNSEIHESSFVLPTWAKKYLK